jgi:hypothetical protein
LLLGCIATWVAYTLIARALLAGIDSLQATAVSAVFGTALLWAAALALDGAAVAGASLAALSAAGWSSLIFLAAGSTVLAYAWCRCSAWPARRSCWASASMPRSGSAARWRWRAWC